MMPEQFISTCTSPIRLGKHHSDKFECGLCDLEIEGLENLEIHLNTCEVFQCDWDKDKCKERFKTLIDIKKHFGEVHTESLFILNN